MIPVLAVLLFVGLAASLAYDPPPDGGHIHMHQAYRIYADGDRIWFPAFNYANQHLGVHVHEGEPQSPGRSDEVLHVHQVGMTFGMFLESLRVDVAPGHLGLDSPEENPRSVHQGQVFADNATHAWRFFVQANGTGWERVAGDPVDYASHVLGPEERLLLTFVPRDLPDDAPVIRAQQDSVLDWLDEWPQITPDE